MCKNNPNQPDTAWKDVLDVYLKDFLDYCLPEVSKLIDWDKNWEPLDKEFHAISKDNITGTRLVDKLVKVYLKDGQEQWVLIHVEVQGQRDDKFPQRMFTYAYRLYDKYQQPIISCAVLTDESKVWCPSYFEVGLVGSKLRLDYLVVKLIDYEQKLEELEKDRRPFASIILTHLVALKAKNKKDEERADIKYSLTRRLYDRGMDKKQITTLYYFIDWLIGLPRAFELEYLQKVYELEEAKKMAYVSSAERIGIEKGVMQGESNLLICQIKHKFGDISKKYQELLSHADAKTLLLWGERVIDAQTLDDVFEDK